ncbi:MAG: hypothetical protein DSZ24_00155 [Thermodesulfatator sp.]|nr:MAG: hypothetical protein DSZ24_00155 [Thermodesulfatator sp.]
MKKLMGCFLLLIFLLLSGPAEAKVLRQVEKEVYAVYIIPAPVGFPTELGYVMTNFGPGNVNFLERVDLVVDREGRVQGIQVVYTPPDGFRRHVFLRGPRSLVIEEPQPGSHKKRIFLRVITTEELNQLD